MNLVLFLLSIVALCKWPSASSVPVMLLGDASKAGEVTFVPVTPFRNSSVGARSPRLTRPRPPPLFGLSYTVKFDDPKTGEKSAQEKLKTYFENIRLQRSVDSFKLRGNITTLQDLRGRRRSKRSFSRIMRWTSAFVMEFRDQVINLFFCDAKPPNSLEEIRNLTIEELDALSCFLPVYQMIKINIYSFFDAVAYLFTPEGARDVGKRFFENMLYLSLPDFLLNSMMVAWRDTFLLGIPLAIDSNNDNPGGDTRDFFEALALFFKG